MSEFDPNVNSEQEQVQEETPSYTPAGFEKRVAAWMGIAYVLLIMFAVTFSIYTGGKMLAGTFPLFLVPVSVAAGINTVYRLCKKELSGGVVTAVIIVIICLAAAVFGLLLGVPALGEAIRAARVR